MPLPRAILRQHGGLRVIHGVIRPCSNENSLRLRLLLHQETRCLSRALLSLQQNHQSFGA
jgi:hypothetical protein